MPQHFCEKFTPLTSIESPIFQAEKLHVWVKREDLNHPQIQGNKWHKLKFNIREALAQNKTMLLTFGGAYSNHIAATAAAAQQHGLQSIGIIRGDELANTPDKWSHTLRQAQQNGMTLHFVSRMQYRQKTQVDYLQTLQQQYPQAFIIPEGGSNPLAIKGFASLMQQLETQCPAWTHLLTAVGTGGTLAGLVTYAKFDSNRQILGIPVLKQADYLQPQISDWIQNEQPNRWSLLPHYHGGGYAKTTPHIENLAHAFTREFDIPLDPIYTAKLINAFYDLVEKQVFPPHSKVILLHTGGLQGGLLPNDN